MNVNSILRRAWPILWQYRALWLFGAVLALVGPHTFGPLYEGKRESNDQWVRIKIDEATTLQLPGADVTIDLTAPEGVRITGDDAPTWDEFRRLVGQVDRATSINLWPILIELAVLVAGLIMVGAVARYVVETALIRMVAEAEATGRRLTIRQGLRRGLSLQAGRLFLVDLAVGLAALVAIIAVFALATVPTLLALGRPAAVLAIAVAGTVGLLMVAGSAWFIVSLALSLFMQSVRRACVLEDQGAWPSVRQGLALTWRHLKQLGLLWLIWAGIRLLWVPLGLVVALLLAPFLVVAVLGGLALGAFPAAVVALIAGQYTSAATAGIMGALVGLPILVVVTLSPFLFVNGLMEIYASTIWTLAYLDLRAVERPAPEPLAPRPLALSPGAAR